MSRSRPSRRAFLRTVGGGAALLPMLEIDRAFGATAPRRMILMNTTNGVLAEHFFPGGAGTRLDELTLPTVTAPLSAIKDDAVIIGGINLKNFTDYPNHGAGHENFSCLFTGARGHEVQDGGARFVGVQTLDQYVATELASQVKLPIKSLNLGLVGGNYWHQSRCYYRGANDPITPETDPVKTFATVFGGGAPVGGGTPSPDVARLAAERKSMLDFLGRDIDGFAKRVGTADRQRIDAHVQSIRELEQQIGALSAAPMATGGACSPGAAPAVDAAGVTKGGMQVPAVLNAQMDLIVSAFRCDATRVAAIQLSSGNGAGWMFSFIGLDGPGQEYKTRDHHDIAHRPGTGGADKNKVDRWAVEQLIALAKKLKSIPEGTGTMLDNTVILLANHMGNGGAHSSTNLPFVLAGRGGGYIKTNQYIRGNGAPTNGIYKVLAASMGVNPDKFGDPKYGGELAALKA